MKLSDLKIDASGFLARRAAGTPSQAFGIGVPAVANTPELLRVAGLPRRVLVGGEEVAATYTQRLKSKTGTMKLWPLQALALSEMEANRGLLAPIVVGGGKTLISFLAPTVLGAKKPLLLVPASLREKTRREFDRLQEHWNVDTVPEVLSYEKLGRHEAADMLVSMSPDLVVADECHRLRNTKAASVRRVSRYFQHYSDTMFVGMSGTITSRSLLDFHHLLRWAVGEKNMPVPAKWYEAREWADAVDEKIDRRAKPGALKVFYGAPEEQIPDELAKVRHAVRRRIAETSGCVFSSDDRPGMSLQIGLTDTPFSANIKSALDGMRATWVSPGGYPIADPMTHWRIARQVGLGFYYEWLEQPPEAWLDARVEWARVCRYIVDKNRRNIDSEGQLVRKVQAGEYRGEILKGSGVHKAVDEVYAAWIAVRDVFLPETRAVWFERNVLTFVAQWMQELPSIVWVEHRSFGEQLSKLTGAPYFSNEGRSLDGRFIEDWSVRDGSMIASIAANGEGRNLQRWRRSLVTSPPAQGRTWEQLLGRTHRFGQIADEVTYDVLISCEEAAEAFEQAFSDAEYISSGQQIQKLNYADIVTRNTIDKETQT